MELQLMLTMAIYFAGGLLAGFLLGWRAAEKKIRDRSFDETLTYSEDPTAGMF